VAAPGFGRLLRAANFRTFWLGFTVSVLGDAMTRVALTWMVFERTGSAAAVGWLTVAFTAPVLVGGFLAGMLLDRFDRRRVLMADNLVRGAVMALVPVLHLLDRLPLAVVYVAATVYSFLMMISLAGCPAFVTALVDEADRSSANALETLSYTLAGVIGAPLAGLLIAQVGAPAVVALDAASYFIFAAALWSLAPGGDAARRPTGGPGTSLAAAFRLLAGNRVLRTTTVMFMAYNVGFGALTVWLPFHADGLHGGGPELFGLLLGGIAAGQCVGALLAGMASLPVPAGLAIALAQALAGGSLLILTWRGSLPATLAGLVLLGFFSAPLTIWAQTLRMKIIPGPLLGRSFALIRTMIQGAGPLGGAAAGLLLDGAGLGAVVLATAVVIGLPGVAGLFEAEVCRADPATVTPAEIEILRPRGEHPGG
jgi:MFS family permease